MAKSYVTLILSNQGDRTLAERLNKEPLLKLVERGIDAITFVHRDDKFISLVVYPNHPDCEGWSAAKCLLEYSELSGQHKVMPKNYLRLYHKIKPSLGEIRWLNSWSTPPVSKEPVRLRRSI